MILYLGIIRFEIIFPKINATRVDIAAPIIPNIGIRMKFRVKLIIKARADLITTYFCVSYDTITCVVQAPIDAIKGIKNITLRSSLTDEYFCPKKRRIRGSNNK